MSLSPHAEQPSPRPAATSPRWGWRVILEYCGQRREDRLLPPDAEVTIGEASGSTVIVPGVGGATGLSSLVAAGRPVVPDGLELVHDGREPRGGGPLALGAGVVMRVRAHPEIVVELRRESAPLARFGSRVAWSELGRTIVYGLSVLALFGIGTAVSHPIAEVLAYGDPNGEDSPIARAMFNTVRLVEPGPRVEWGGVEPMVAMGEGEVEAEEDVEVEEPEDVDIWGSPEEGPVVIGTTEEPVEAAIAEEVPTPEPTVEPTVEPTAKPKPKPKPVSRLETATAMIATAELEPARGEPELPLAVLVGDPDTEPGLILDVLEAAPLDLEIVEEPASVTISVAEEPEPTVAHALADAAAEGPALSHVVKAGPELAKGVVIGTAGAEPEFTCEDPTQR
ncbi:MAG: hypothetical protein KC468_10665, partial [Myxococcales bacterium]|nr:hypothetical protein [Myxococcales bacterium]